MQTSACVGFSPFPPGFDTLPAEFPTLPEQQDELQLGVRDAAVSGLYLWEHDRWTRPPWAVHKREERRAHQPDTGKFDRVLSGALPREPGIPPAARQGITLLPHPRRALLGSAPRLRGRGVPERCSLCLPYKGNGAWGCFPL